MKKEATIGALLTVGVTLAIAIIAGWINLSSQTSATKTQSENNYELIKMSIETDKKQTEIQNTTTQILFELKGKVEANEKE